MKAPTLEENAKRGEYLDALYKLDERDKPDHPQAGLYTGLHQEILITERIYKELLIYEKWKSRGYPDLPLPQ
jgi:hypothetical protein